MICIHETIYKEGILIDFNCPNFDDRPKTVGVMAYKLKTPTIFIFTTVMSTILVETQLDFSFSCTWSNFLLLL